MIGRYIEADPIGIIQEVKYLLTRNSTNERNVETASFGIIEGINHLYAYVAANPINRQDVKGLYLSPPCMAALTEMAYLAWQVHIGKLGDKRGHCLAHCKVKKGCGWGIGDLLSWLIGYGKEDYDEYIKKRGADPEDIDANEKGRTCPLTKSCEEQCKNLWR